MIAIVQYLGHSISSPIQAYLASRVYAPGHHEVPSQYREPWSRMMKMKYFLTALLLLPSLAMSAMTQARTNESSGLPRAYAIEGREIAAPPWSFACMSDQGPRQCDEPMWVYGSPPALARYKNAF